MDPSTRVRIPALASCSVVRVPIRLKNTYADTGNVSHGDESRAPCRYDRPFHLVKEEYAQHSLERGREIGLLTASDEELITAYVTELRSTVHISTARANKITFTLVNWRNHIGPYTENGVLEIYRGIDHIKQATHRGGSTADLWLYLEF